VTGVNARVKRPAPPLDRKRLDLGQRMRIKKLSANAAARRCSTGVSRLASRTAIHHLN